MLLQKAKFFNDAVGFSMVFNACLCIYTVDTTQYWYMQLSMEGERLSGDLYAVTEIRKNKSFVNENIIVLISKNYLLVECLLVPTKL